MMIKLAIATLFLVSAIHCQDGVKTAAASNTRSYFINHNPRPIALRQSGQTQVAASSFHPAALRPRPQAAQVPSASSGSGSVIRSDLPVTSFSCSDKPYIPGIYADVEAGCEVFHVCTTNYTYSFACGEGTAFDQQLLTCQRAINFTCTDTPKYYSATSGIGVETGIETPAVQKTSFTCADKPHPIGLYADLEAGCRIFHYCNGEEDFAQNCAEGTVFDQEKLICNYPSEVVCKNSPNFYHVNAGNGVAL